MARVWLLMTTLRRYAPYLFLFVSRRFTFWYFLLHRVFLHLCSGRILGVSHHQNKAHQPDHQGKHKTGTHTAPLIRSRSIQVCRLEVLVGALCTTGGSFAYCSFIQRGQKALLECTAAVDNVDICLLVCSDRIWSGSIVSDPELNRRCLDSWVYLRRGYPSMALRRS